MPTRRQSALASYNDQADVSVTADTLADSDGAMDNNNPTSPPPANGTDAVFVGEARYCSKLKRLVYQAVDYVGARFRVGDHVCMNTLEGEEWVCVIEALFKDNNGVPTFKGRWFWSVDDVANQRDSFKDVMRPSKCATHELIASDSCDNNQIELITRKCHILNFDTFQLVRKIVTRADYTMEKVYFCHRQFYHMSFRFSDLNNVTFPGDPIPLPLRKAAGLPVNVVNPLYYSPAAAAALGPDPDADLFASERRKGVSDGSAFRKSGGNDGISDRPNKVIVDEHPHIQRRRLHNHAGHLGDHGPLPNGLHPADAYFEPDYVGKIITIGRRKKDRKDKYQHISSQAIHIW